MTEKKLIVFIPTFRCEAQIPRVLSQLTPDILEHVNEVVVIDNQSPDLTCTNALVAVEKTPHLRNRVRIVRNPVNLGLGGSHKMAFDYALENNFSGCIVLHGDDQGNIRDLLSLLPNLVNEDRFIFGCRFHRTSNLVGYSRFRKISNILLNLISSFVLRRRIYDFGGSGLNFFPSSLLRRHHFWHYSDDLTFHSFVVVNAIRLKQSVVFHPISWRTDDQISNVRIFSQAMNLAGILLSTLLGSKFHCSDVPKEKPGKWQQIRL